MTAMPRASVLKSGRTVYRVNFRLVPGGNVTTETFDDYDSAMRFSRLVDQVGGRKAREARDAASQPRWNAMTVGDAVDRYIAAAESSATPGTVRTYRQIAETKIKPALGSIPLDVLTRTDVESWIGYWRRQTITRGKTKGRPMSGKSLKNMHGLLSAALQRQVQDGALDRNVAYGIRIPQDAVHEEMVFLRGAEVQQIIDAADPFYRPLIAFLYFTGMRYGEAVALTPADFDLDAAPPTVRVTKAWKQGDGGYYLGQPKTRMSRRTIELPPAIIPMIRDLVEGKSAGDLVFTSKTGLMLKSGTFHSKGWQPAVARANLRSRPRVHDLRHSHASELIGAGVPLPVVQRRLGHESVSTTVGVYGHLASDAGVQAAAAIAATMPWMGGAPQPLGAVE